MTTSPSNDADILLTDRTSIETDWECGQKLFWYKHYGKKGIVPVVEADYFKQGREIHQDLARIASGEPYEAIVAEILDQLDVTYPPGEARPQSVLEPLYRRMGWGVAFATWIWPLLRGEGKLLSAEEELILDRSPLWIACTPDGNILHPDGKIVTYDFKSVTNPGPGWAAHWTTAVQQQINAKAVEEEYKKPVKWSLIVGLNKGYEKDGRLHHPYVWAYDHGGELSPEYKYKAPLVPIWESGISISDWVLKCGEEVGKAQFPFSQPIFANDRLLDEMLFSQQLRQEQIKQVKGACQLNPILRSIYFEKRFSNCRPMRGKECQYYAACHNKQVGDDPIGSGLYAERTPHHDVEILGEEDE